MSLRLFRSFWGLPLGFHSPKIEKNISPKHITHSFPFILTQNPGTVTVSSCFVWLHVRPFLGCNISQCLGFGWKCRLPAVWPWDQSKVVCRAFCTYWYILHMNYPTCTSINPHKYQGREKHLYTDCWEYIFRKTIKLKAITRNIAYSITYVLPFFSSPLSLSISRSYHTSISLRIVQQNWMHNQSLTLIFLTFQQGLKGTELIWITSILTVLPYSKAENAPK